MAEHPEFSGQDLPDLVDANSSDSTVNSRSPVTASDRIRELLNDHLEGNASSMVKPETSPMPMNSSNEDTVDMDAPIKREKQESPGLEILTKGFESGKVYEISDTEEDAPVKLENEDEEPFKWISMPDTTISLLDDSDDDVVAETPLPAREFSPRREIAGEENDDLIELGVNNTNSQIQSSGPSLPSTSTEAETPEQRTQALLKKQQEYARKIRQNFAAKGAGNIFRAPQPSQATATHGSQNDGHAWMSDTVLPNDTPATDFQTMKQSYKPKCKAHKNTLEDDVQFKKAEMEEKQRLKMLTLELNCDDETESEAEESDNELFVSSKKPPPPGPPSGDDDSEDDDIEQRLEELLTGKTPAKKPKTAVLIDQPELSTSRNRDKAFKKELRSNMMAGIEAILFRDQKRQEEKAWKDAQAAAAARTNQKGRKRKATKFVDHSTKRTKTGRTSNIATLLSSNIFEDSNANLDKPALPQVTDKKKKDFMTSLIANIPLADQKQAKADKINIVRASKILAKHNVKPDSEGNWAVRGLRSSLYHYQVQGAAQMKLREIGEKEPYGGILAGEIIRLISVAMRGN